MFQLPFLLLLSILISLDIGLAFQFTYPSTPGTTLNFSELTSITITWESNRTDPAIGRMLLVNTAVTPHSLTTITNRVEVAKKSHTVRREFGLNLVGGGTYHFTFMDLENGDLSVDSYEFVVEGGRDGDPGTSSFGEMTGSATGVSSTITSTTTQTSASATSQTSAVATGTPSSTASPNQSGGSSDKLLNVRLKAVLTLVVVAWIFN